MEWCKNCGEWIEPKLETVNEDTDADGNRGRQVTYATCPKCDEEL